MATYVAKNSVPIGDDTNFLHAVHAALPKLGTSSERELTTLTSPVPIRSSITPDYLISLEGGRPYKSLNPHLVIRDLTPHQCRS